MLNVAFKTTLKYVLEIKRPQIYQIILWLDWILYWKKNFDVKFVFKYLHYCLLFLKIRFDGSNVVLFEHVIKEHLTSLILSTFARSWKRSQNQYSWIIMFNKKSKRQKPIRSKIWFTMYDSYSDDLVTWNWWLGVERFWAPNTARCFLFGIFEIVILIGKDSSSILMNSKNPINNKEHITRYLTNVHDDNLLFIILNGNTKLSVILGYTLLLKLYHNIEEYFSYVFKNIWNVLSFK